MKRILDGVKRMANVATDALKRPAPAELATLILSERKRRCLPNSSREALERAGLDPATFDWLLPAIQLYGPATLGDETNGEDGYLACSGDTLWAFGYVGGQFQMEQCSVALAGWEIGSDLPMPEFSIQLPLKYFRQARISLDSASDYAAGPWWNLLEAASKGRKFANGAILGIARVSAREVRREGFGLTPAAESRGSVCWLDEEGLSVWPGGSKFELAKIAAWNSPSDSGLQFCVVDAERITLVEFDQLTCGSEPTLVRASKTVLNAARPPRSSLREILELSGLFTGWKAGNDPAELLWLWKHGNKLTRDPFGDDDHQSFALGYALNDRAIVSHLDGDAFAIRTEPGASRAICDLLPGFTELRGSATGPWGVFLKTSEATRAENPILIRLLEHGLRIGTATDIPWHLLVIEDGAILTGDTATARLRRRDDEAWQCEFWGPKSLVISLRGEVEVRQVKCIVTKENPGALYHRWATLRRDSFLFLILGDVATLLEELNNGSDLVEAANLLSDAKPENLTAEQRKALESALRQLTLLAAALPQIKQRLELISLETPYAWAQQEQTWLESLFGAKCAKSAGEKEANRGRELLSRSIRSLIAPMQRSLAELEAGMRPAESLFFREEIQQHWSMTARRWGPTAVTIILAGTAAVATGGASLPMIAPAIGIGLNQILAGETEKVLHDREKVLILRRTVELAAGWIDLLRRGAEVSASEARRFVDNENERAARRDRALFEQCPPQLRESVLANLREEILRRSAAAKRASFVELAPGSAKRLGCTASLIAQLSDRSSSRLTSPQVTAGADSNL